VTHGDGETRSRSGVSWARRSIQYRFRRLSHPGDISSPYVSTHLLTLQTIAFRAYLVISVTRTWRSVRWKPLHSESLRYRRLHVQSLTPRRAMQADRLIKLIVGEPESATVFYASKATLEATAEYFTSALRNQHLGDVERDTLTFSDEDLLSWQILLFWMIKHELPSPRDV